MVKIGLVGHGAWGSNILRDLIKLGAKVYVADTNPEAGTCALKNGAADTFSSTAELPDCDGYIVAVPIPLLSPVCAELLPRKKPIFSEKTLLLSEKDFYELKELDGDRFIFSMHKWQYHPGVEKLRKIIQNGRIGDILQISTTRYNWVNDFHGGDVFWTQGIHDISIVKHLLGFIPEKIQAVNVIKNRDNLPVSFDAILGDIPAVVLSVSGAHCFKRSGVMISCENGSAGLYNAYDDHIIVTDKEGSEEIQIDQTFPLFLELKEFIEYLSGGHEPKCDLNASFELTSSILDLRKAAGLNNILKG